MTEPADQQRIDQWLWHARFLKTRSQATRLVEAGKVRINREKTSKPGRLVRPGDILTFMRAEQLHVIEVVATATRRGPASEAQRLYQPACAGNSAQSTRNDQKKDA